MTANFFFKNLTPIVTEGENVQLEVTRTGDLTQSVSFFVHGVSSGTAPAMSAGASDMEWPWADGSKMVTFQPGSTKEIVSLATWRDGVQEPTEFAAMAITPHYYYGPDMWARRTDVTASPAIPITILDADTAVIVPETVVEPTPAPVVEPEPTPAPTPTPTINNSYNTYNTYNYTYNFTDNSVNTTTTVTDNSVNTYTFSFMPPSWEEKFRGTGSADEITGTGVNDLISGSGGADTLIGAEGDDQLVGGGGTDLLDGGAGANYYNGGGGLDTYVVQLDGQADFIRGLNQMEDIEVQGFTGTLSVESIKGGWGLFAEDMMVAAIAGRQRVYESFLTEAAGI
jgi:Ca2+-binding RTX toxin-like protein